MGCSRWSEGCIGPSMPTAAVGFCPRHGCGVRSNGPCKDHRRERQQVVDARRGSRHERGYTNKWAAYSKARLAEHPWCVGYPEPHTIRTLATCTDHIQSGAAAPERFWDETNHQSLCRDCNTRKAIALEGGFGHQAPQGGM